MTWTLEDVAKHYDETVDYDEINERTYAHMRRFTDGFILSNIKDGSRVLDICCRTGKGALYFGKKKKLSFFCLDVSDCMLKIAGERLKKEEIDVELKKFTFLDLQLEDNFFDAILSFETVEHMPTPQKFISELGRVIKPDGELILTTPNTYWEFIHELAAVMRLHHSEGPHEFIPRKKLIEYLNLAGFNIKTEKTTVLIPAGPNFLIKFGEILERIIPENVMRYIGLRRIFVCKKKSG